MSETPLEKAFRLNREYNANMQMVDRYTTFAREYQELADAVRKRLNETINKLSEEEFIKFARQVRPEEDESD